LRTQLVSALALAFSYGTNDAQKTMGILPRPGYDRLPGDFPRTLWVLFSASMIAWHIPGWLAADQDPGSKIHRIKPVDGFCAQTTSALVILTASLMGARSAQPTVSSAIMV
jgi:PiT family inorganic phosphate transporter